MADRERTLKALGLEPDDDEHPANVTVLKALGLEPDPDEHPINADPYGFGDPARVVPVAPPRSTLRDIREAIDPSRVLPAVASGVGSNIADYFKSGVGMMGRGLSNITANRPATGAGEVALGGLSAVMSPFSGTVKSGENALASITGNPDFADKAALMVPLNVGGPVAKTAAFGVRPSTKAADLVAERMTPEMLERMQSNPRLRAMDVSKGVRDLGVGIAKDTSQPRAMTPVVSSMEQSAASAKNAVRGTYNETMGTPPDAWEELTRLQNKAKSIGQAKITPALIASKPVDTSGVIADIDKALNPAAVKMTPGTTITPTPLQQKLVGLRQQLASGDKEVLTDADRLHDIQSELRREADDLMSSATGSDRTLGRQLKDYRNKLVDSIDVAAPGYKEGLKAYRDQKDIERAYQMGQDLLINSKDPKTAPGYLEQWINSKDRSPEEIAALKLGQRQAVEQKMGSIKSSGLDAGRSGTDIPQVDFNRKKLELAWGKDATDKMFRHLQDERDVAFTNSRGLANSTTGEALAAQKLLQPREISKPHSQLPTWALAAGAGAGALTSPSIGALVGGGMLGARGVKAGYDWIGRQMDLSRNASLAQLISRNDPQTIATLTAALNRSNRRNKLNNLLAPP